MLRNGRWVTQKPLTQPTYNLPNIECNRIEVCRDAGDRQQRLHFGVNQVGRLFGVIEPELVADG